MIAASRLFLGMGFFGLIAGAIYYLTNDDPELAGVGLLGAFFAACLFVGWMLYSVSAANKRRQAVPDTGLHGSAHPERGARDEHGNIHHLPPTLAPVVYSLAATLLLAAFVYRDQIAGIGPAGIAAGTVLFLVATALWYRAVVADTRALLQGGHATHDAPAGTLDLEEEAPPPPPGPANYFEQVRAAFEVGDSDWAADAYAPDAVYYEPANPPHEGRDSIRAYLNDLLKGHRDLHFTVQRMGVDGDSAIVEWLWTFRRPDGRRVSNQPGVTVIQTGPDGIRYHRDYL